MFTGIIQEKATVTYVNHSNKLTKYTLQISDSALSNLKIGASISVNGTCQTVVAIENNQVSFDAIEETLLKTTLRYLSVGKSVNIERSAKIGDEIGGHLISGHVFGTATIKAIFSPTPEQRIFTLQCPSEWMKYILPKGYIALNGASLTLVNTKPEGEFTVHLIPETLRLTTFGNAKIDELVNVEIDHQTQLIVETVERIFRDKM